MKLDLEISVCHFPPGTSKWNKIEHRMKPSQITKNWRGRPLETLRSNCQPPSLLPPLQLVLKFNVSLTKHQYEKGIKVSDSEFDSLRLVGDEFHPNWNYTISPLYD